MLKNLDPKECFKSLKGVSASKIQEKIPIKPILTFKKDSRLIESKEILENVEEENLAVMDWDDFEHLIREWGLNREESPNKSTTLQSERKEASYSDSEDLSSNGLRNWRWREDSTVLTFYDFEFLCLLIQNLIMHQQ